MNPLCRAKANNRYNMKITMITSRRAILCVCET